MMSRSICFLSLFFALCVSVSMAFSMPKQSVHPSTTAKIDIKVTTAAVTTTAAAATAFVTSVMYPLAALAVQEDNYEYGAVDAPPLVPIIGGVLAILTALLPILLRGGEEAFEEMKDKDGFGSGRDVLNKRKK